MSHQFHTNVSAWYQIYQKQDEAYEFFLLGNDGYVGFPLFLGNIITRTNSPVYVPYSTKILQALLTFVQSLPMAARDIHGNPQSSKTINQSTLFLNPFIKIAQKRSTIRDPKLLGTLYEATTHLGIKPLMNGFAFYIANQIHPLSTSIDVALQRFSLNMDKINPMPIEKYIQLKEIGVSELSVSDYIGLYGQPKIVDGCLNLTGEGLTSLEGLEYIIQSSEITDIILDENYILLDPSLPLKKVTAPFSQLKKMSFRGNQPSQLPLNSFHDLKNIQITL